MYIDVAGGRVYRWADADQGRGHCVGRVGTLKPTRETDVDLQLEIYFKYKYINKQATDS